MPDFTNALLIVNPVAGTGFASRYARRLVRDLERRGLSVEQRNSAQPGDITDWSRRAGAEGFDLVCVLGGDGSLQEAVAGQVDAPTKVPLAHIAAGTANVIPLTLALPWFPGPAVSAVFQGRVLEFDVGYLVHRKRHFILMTAVGYPANIIKDSPRRLKNFFGLGTYVVAAISNLFRRQSAMVTVVADGHRRRRRANTVFLTNIGSLPDLKLRMTPDTDPQDGFLDITLISSRTLWDVLVILARMLVWRGPRARRMTHFKAREVRIDADPPLPVQIDGEVLGTTPVEARILPRAVKLVVGPRYRSGVNRDASAGR
ncbi:MAG: diacylglycerol kinase family lipid kinase [Candidatus Krumholzibacteriia bacterium]